MIKFSILIPAYKTSFLGEAIQSVLSQTYKEFELIIVDDHSPEDIKSVVDKIPDERILYFRNENNCGAVNVVDNWNICLSKSSGDFVICMGDDDILCPDCLAVYYKLIAKYPDVSVLHGWTELIDENGEFVSITPKRPEYESVYEMIFNRWYGRKDQFIGDWCFKRTVLVSNGGFYKIPLAWGADDITAAICSACAGVANTQDIVFQYRVNSRTISNTGNVDIKIEAIKEERIWYKNFLEKEPECFSDKQCWISLKHLEPIFYKAKIKNTILQNIKQHPARIIYWITKKVFYKYVL